MTRDPRRNARRLLLLFVDMSGGTLGAGLGGDHAAQTSP
jgi:hypothetical protein